MEPSVILTRHPVLTMLRARVASQSQESEVRQIVGEGDWEKFVRSGSLEVSVRDEERSELSRLGL